MSLWGMSRLVRGVFRFGLWLAVPAIGCGGRTSGSSAASGSGLGAIAGSAGLSTGTAAGSTGPGSGDARASTGSTTGSSGAASVVGTGATAATVSESSGSSAAMSGYCDQTEVNGGPRCPLCQNGMLSKCMGDCVDIRTDPNNCNGCGITCPVSAPSCDNGSCAPGGRRERRCDVDAGNGRGCRSAPELPPGRSWDDQLWPRGQRNRELLHELGSNRRGLWPDIHVGRRRGADEPCRPGHGHELRFG